MLTVKTDLVTKQTHAPRAWTDPFVRPERWRRDVRFITRNVMILCRSGSLRGIRQI